MVFAGKFLVDLLGWIGKIEFFFDDLLTPFRLNVNKFPCQRFLFSNNNKLINFFLISQLQCNKAKLTNEHLFRCKEKRHKR